MANTEYKAERRINQGAMLDDQTENLATDLWEMLHDEDQVLHDSETTLTADKVAYEGMENNKITIGTVIVKMQGSLELHNARLGIFFRKKPETLDESQLADWINKVGSEEEKQATEPKIIYANPGFLQSFPSSMAVFFPESRPITIEAPIEMPGLIIQQTDTGWKTELQQDIPPDGVQLCLHEAMTTLRDSKDEAIFKLPLAV